MFQDKDFPPDKDSLGPIKTSKKIAWKRAQDITYRYKNISGKINKLFDAGMYVQHMRVMRSDCFTGILMTFARVNLEIVGY